MVSNAADQVFANIFGYLDGGYRVTHLLRKLDEFRSPPDVWAIMDADKSSITYGPWRVNLPAKRVHGAVWNRVYLDGTSRR